MKIPTPDEWTAEQRERVAVAASLLRTARRRRIAAAVATEQSGDAA